MAIRYETIGKTKNSKSFFGHKTTEKHCLHSDKSVFGIGVEEKLPPQNVTVSINTISLDQNSGQVYQVEKLTHHPQYNITNLNTAEYDLAIIKV